MLMIQVNKVFVFSLLCEQYFIHNTDWVPDLIRIFTRYCVQRWMRLLAPYVMPGSGKRHSVNAFGISDIISASEELSPVGKQVPIWAYYVYQSVWLRVGVERNC